MGPTAFSFPVFFANTDFGGFYLAGKHSGNDCYRHLSRSKGNSAANLYKEKKKGMKRS